MSVGAPTRMQRRVHEVGGMSVRYVDETFRRPTIGEPGALAAIIDHYGRTGDSAQLDALTEALIRVGALIALDGSPASYRTAVDDADRAGAGLDHLLAVLLAVAGTVGSARVISAAPRIAQAAGYDVEAALLALEHDGCDPAARATRKE